MTEDVPGHPKTGAGAGPARAPCSLVLALLAVSALGAPAGAQDGRERYHPFQQGVAYRVEASLDPSTHVLTGRARLRYTNHAPEPLTRLYFHQYLNAFRPNSGWASHDLRFGNRTFQDLGPEAHAFEQVTGFSLDGSPAEPVYPGSPDSTVFYVELPTPLEPGATVEALIDWRARLATEPRRQGREGRHYNWAHWYPRIAFYGADGWEYRPHIRLGELNGAFADYDVTLELPADLVVGATGVPAYGDPGWEAAMVPGSDPPLYLRDYYGGHPAEGLGLLDGPTPDRKQNRWRAANVHNFAWSAAPDYRYLGGRWRGTPIHLLWRPGSGEWHPERVLSQQKAALDWLAWLFGEYPWPQITVTDRVEGGATEYPMLYMTDGGAIAHETLHMIVHGALANNEWRAGWLDEGLVEFLSDWLRVEQGADPERVWGRDRDVIARADRLGRTEPVGLAGAEFSSFGMYQAMTYEKGALVLRMLRDMLGEETFREGLAEYYRRFRFRNVTRTDFRRVMEDVSGRELEWFFGQWLDTTAWLDYGVADVTVSGTAGDVTVTAEIVRDGDAWMPVVVEAGGARTTVQSRGRRFTVTLHPASRPRAVVVDPDGSLLDADRTNNRYDLR